MKQAGPESPASRREPACGSGARGNVLRSDGSSLSLSCSVLYNDALQMPAPEMAAQRREAVRCLRQGLQRTGQPLGNSK